MMSLENAIHSLLNWAINSPIVITIAGIAFIVLLIKVIGDEYLG